MTRRPGLPAGHGTAIAVGIATDDSSGDAVDDAGLLQAGFRYALSLSHDHHDAEDLVQEAWLRLCRSYGSVANRALLFTAVRNLFTDRLRRSKVVAFEPLDDTRAAADFDETASVAGVNGDLEVLLGGLRAAEREALFLHHVEGRTAQEIGELTGQSRNTVLSLMHRGLAKLRAAAAENPTALRNRMLLWFVSLF